MRPDKKGKLVNTYLGKIVVYTKDLTPEFLAELKTDRDDIQGWHKYRQVMKEHGHNIDVEVIE